jgi:hypothetical protein
MLKKILQILLQNMESINLMDMKIKDKKFKKLLNDLKYLH